ncbi:MAG: hypothetical protein M3R17_00205 [Bacteroidota bacterium]|nr:hypothetical protein [Bacteroidota bacterium]
MPQRIEAENKLKQLFISKGGKPERNCPHYFSLGSSPVFELLYKNNFQTIKIPVADFTESELCFCINDSLWTMAESRNPGMMFNNRWFEGDVYSYKETCAILEELELNV